MNNSNVDTSLLSSDQKLCWDEILKGTNLFITSRAGSGKSYLIRFIDNNYQDFVILTASTGIAANNIGGRTLHSMFLIDPNNPDPNDSAKKILMISDKRTFIKKAKLLIIDEISMVSDRLLGYVSEILKIVKKCPHKPFGGIQVAFFGDFLQLPPVFKGDSKNDKICWDCKLWKDANIKSILMTSNFRQINDETFYDILYRLRYNQMNYQDIEMILKRSISCDDKAIRVFSTNAEVDVYNDAKFKKLSYKTEHSYNAKCYGDFKLIKNYWKDSLIPEEVILRKGARVMLCKNMVSGDYYLYNGSLGEVVDFVSRDNLPLIKFDCGCITMIGEEVIYQVKDRTKLSDRQIIAEIKQVPLKLGYAVTVHKSQGQTFDKIYVDCSRTFLLGQVYTAFSRARSLDGLYISGFNPRSKGSFSDQNLVNKYLELENDAKNRHK